MTNAQRHALGVLQFPRRVARSPKRRLGAMKVVAEFLDKTQEEDLMKYLLMIATLAAFISTATATSPAADCCKGNRQCCPGKCCKK